VNRKDELVMSAIGAAVGAWFAVLFPAEYFRRKGVRMSLKRDAKERREWAGAVLEAARQMDAATQDEALAMLQPEELAELRHIVDRMDQRINGEWRSQGCP